MPSIADEHVAHVHEARALLARQVDLRHVAGDDDLRAEPEPRQEHLHLLGRGVLRLVEDDEAVVQRAAAHERERRDLDRAAVDQVERLVGVEHVVERVEQRAQVGIDLRHQVARQEAEALARLDGGARQDDARRPRARAARRRPSPSRGTSCRCRPGRSRTSRSSAGSGRRTPSASPSSARSSCRGAARRPHRTRRGRPGPASSVPSTASTVCEPIWWPPSTSSTSSSITARAFSTCWSSPSRVSWLPRRRTVQVRRSRRASSTPSEIPASSAATAFETSSVCCIGSV